MASPSAFLNRDVAHIKEDLRITAERLWNLDAAAFEGVDPVVDLLLSAFAQEIFTVQEDVQRNKLRMVEMTAQAMLPVELSAPRPAHAILHGRPLDPGTYTHRVKTVLSATQAMDVHDRVGRTFTFTPADEFRLHNGAVRFMVHGNKLQGIDARSGAKRTIVSGEGRPLSQESLWLGLEMKELVDPDAGLAIYFGLPSNDSDSWQLRLHLPDFRFRVRGANCLTEPGIHPRSPRIPSFNRVLDPVATAESEAIAFYQEQFVTVHAPQEAPDHLNKPGPPPDEFISAFNKEALDELGAQLIWLRVGLPSALSPDLVNRLICSINCFPAINRRHQEKTATGAALISLEHGPHDQFWAVDSVVGGDRLSIPRERSAQPSASGNPVYAVRRGGLERLDEREAYERLTDLLQTVRGDHAAFAALDESDLAEGLTRVKAWLQEYRTRHKAPPFPPVYLMLSEVPSANVHVDYWNTNGAAASRIPAYKAFRLESGSFLSEARSMSVPIGGEDTPSIGSVDERLRGAMGSTDQAMPTLFALRCQCMEIIPAPLRQYVKLDMRREVSMGGTSEAGLSRTMRITLRIAGDAGQEPGMWISLCAQIENILGRRLQGLLPVRVDHRIAG